MSIIIYKLILKQLNFSKNMYFEKTFNVQVLTCHCDNNKNLDTGIFITDNLKHLKLDYFRVILKQKKFNYEENN